MYEPTAETEIKPSPQRRIQHPILMWRNDGTAAAIGMRGRTVFVRIAQQQGKFLVVPTFPLPRGTQVRNNTYGDIETAKRSAELFFQTWLNVVGLKAKSGTSTVAGDR
jgi:hypothetical protein